MKIKKASDKPIVIHQKQKAELHICHNKEMKPRLGNIKCTNRSPKIKSATLNVRDSSDMRLGKNIQKYRMVSTKARSEKRKNTPKARTSENDFNNAKKKLKIYWSPETMKEIISSFEERVSRQKSFEIRKEKVLI